MSKKLMTTNLRFLAMLAAMDDEEFVKFSGSFGYTRKPDPDAETMSNFRERVVENLGFHNATS